MTTLDDKQRMMLKYQNNRVIEAFSTDSDDDDADSNGSNMRNPNIPMDNKAIMSKQKELIKKPQEVANLIYRKVIDLQGKISDTDLRMLKGLSRSWVLEQDPTVQTTDSVAVGDKALSHAASDALSQASRSKKS